MNPYKSTNLQKTRYKMGHLMLTLFLVSQGTVQNDQNQISILSSSNFQTKTNDQEPKSKETTFDEILKQHLIKNPFQDFRLVHTSQISNISQFQIFSLDESNFYSINVFPN